MSGLNPHDAWMRWRASSAHAVAAAIEFGHLDLLKTATDVDALEPGWFAVARLAYNCDPRPSRGAVHFIEGLTDSWIDSAGIESREALVIGAKVALGELHRGLNHNAVEHLFAVARQFGREYKAALAENDPVRVAGLTRLDVPQLLSEPIPTADWLLEGFLERGELAWLAGAGKTGKSALALFLGCALLADAGHFLGRPIGSIPRLVYIDAENRERTIRRRLHSAGIAPEIASRIHYYVARGFDLGSDAGLSALARVSEGGALVILDSMIGLHQADEDKAREVRQLALGLRSVGEATGATFLGLAHENRGGNLRGSLDWRNAADTVLSLTKADSGVRTLRMGDRRDGHDEAEPIAFRFLDERGRLVMHPSEQQTPKRPKGKTEQLAEEIEALRRETPGLTRAETARRLRYEPSHGTFKTAYTKAIQREEEHEGGSRPAVDPRCRAGRAVPSYKGPPALPQHHDPPREVLAEGDGWSAEIVREGVDR